MSKLIYVSHNAIDRKGRINPFFNQEKDCLLRKFGSFVIVCDAGVFSYNGIMEPVISYKRNSRTKIRAVFKAMLDINVYIEISKMFKVRKGSLKNILKLFRYSYDANILYFFIEQVLDNDTLNLYSFWFSFDAYACAKIKEERPNIRFITRAHSYEIQLNRNPCNPFLMKEVTCKQADTIAFISNDSLNCFKTYYQYPLENAKVLYLGSTEVDAGLVERGKNSVFTILTCSSMVPVKRLDRLIVVLSKWTESNLHWIHIGDGPEREKIRKMTSDLLGPNKKISYEFMGNLSNKNVHLVLRREDIDLFVNVSDTEGVPVSIMEAMSVGLPVLAPGICGIPELIDDNCGFLFSIDHAEEELLQTLKEFSSMSLEDRKKIGRAAYRKWQDRFCLEKNLNALFEQG